MGESNSSQLLDKGKEVVTEYSSSSSESGSFPRTQLRVEAPEFVPAPVYNSGTFQRERELRWQGIHLNLGDIKKGHVDPTITTSDPISSRVTPPGPSAQVSMSPKRHRWQRRNARQSWANFTMADDSALTNAQRAYIVDTILAQHEGSRRRIQDAARQAFLASIERTICQDLKKLLPGVSSSNDDLSGEVMRRAQVFAKWPEYQEFIKKDPQREKYAKQAANVQARRAAYKQRELAIPSNSMASKVQDTKLASSSHAISMQNKKTITTSPKNEAKILDPCPTRKRTSTNQFEVLSSMPVEITEADNNTSEASSVSTHFRRKKPRKQVPLAHRPVTRGLSNSGNEKKMFGICRVI